VFFVWIFGVGLLNNLKHKTMETKQEVFYPELSEQGAKQAVELIEKFKDQLTKHAEEAIDALYMDIMPFIEADSWANYRSQIVSGLSNYNNKDTYPYDFQRIRTAIFKQYKDEILKDLNQDLVKENEMLKILSKYYLYRYAVYFTACAHAFIINSFFAILNEFDEAKNVFDELKHNDNTKS
jgi:ribosomal protein S17E